ncbi:tyrosine-type recombinase/integrase [Halorussus salinisoli]|uniref:tyrosine-type recombinase/integrase n=1 Tax=Halorussus salinisoli TaxID=2558242 RepID=UPI0010C23111|nr:site-specific integrase [Halorussus salinisoli]
MSETEPSLNFDTVRQENRRVMEAFWEYLERFEGDSTEAHRKRHTRPFRNWCQANDVRILDPKRYALREFLQSLSNDGHADKYVISAKDAVSQLYNFLLDNSELLADKHSIDRVPIDENPIHGVITDLDIDSSPKKAKATRQDIVALAKDEAEQLVKRENMPDPKVRNELLIRLLIQTGIRAGEATLIRIDDIERAPERRIRIRGEKTKENRSVFYQPSLDPLLEQWIDRGLRAAYPKANESDRLFISHKSGKLTQKAITEIVRTAAENAGIQEVMYENAQGHDMHRVTPHTLRHTFARLWVEDGGDIARLARLMGHTTDDGSPNLETTRKYLRAFGDDALREAALNHAPSLGGN